jgi:hypothetical protein
MAYAISLTGLVMAVAMVTPDINYSYRILIFSIIVVCYLLEGLVKAYRTKYEWLEEVTTPLCLLYPFAVYGWVFLFKIHHQLIKFAYYLFLATGVAVSCHFTIKYGSAKLKKKEKCDNSRQL